MAVDSREPDWAQLCNRTLGSWTPLGRHPTQRAASGVWRIRDRDGDEYVVKRHVTRIRHDREVHAYREWTTHLAGQTPTLVADEAETLAIVLRAVPGVPVDRASLSPSDEAAVHQRAGELLRKMHGISLEDPAAREHDIIAHLQQRFDHRLAQAQRQLARDDLRMVSRLARHLVDLHGLATAACHLDYQPHNWMTDPSAPGRAYFFVVDYEHSRVDLPVRDLVRLETRYWSINPILREAFFDGYGRPLDYDERAALDSCVALDAVSSLARSASGGDARSRDHAETALKWLRNSSRRRRSSHIRGLPAQLRDPDPIGRDLELLRTRSYRFSDDTHRYVFAEAMTDQMLAGRTPSEDAMQFVRHSLARLRAEGVLPAIPSDLVAGAGLDLGDELLRRTPFSYERHLAGSQPELVVAIVGAPRSGTSHLVNLLAATRRFAYLTTASCWAWPTRNLHNPRRLLFSTTDADARRDILAADNKRTRIVPRLVMPGEAEDVFSRAVPVYRHLGGHRYAITQPSRGNSGILRANCSAHLHYFQRHQFLTKSPFNSFRIPALEAIWPGKLRYVHIVRDRDATADSMRRNGFEFAFEGHICTAEDAWARFVDAVRESAPPSRLFTVGHEDVTRRPTVTVARILDWLDRP